jgi:hypothetical protein
LQGMQLVKNNRCWQGNQPCGGREVNYFGGWQRLTTITLSS